MYYTLFLRYFWNAARATFIFIKSQEKIKLIMYYNKKISMRLVIMKEHLDLIAFSIKGGKSEYCIKKKTTTAKLHTHL